MAGKKISPQAVLALKEALAVLFWKKDELRDFVKLTVTNKSIINTIDWVNPTKRESAKELIERMTNRPDIYNDDLISLFMAIADFTDLSHLDYWDENGTLKLRAKEAIERVRNQIKGYIELTKEEESARKRKIETEKRIAKSASLEEELNELKNQFYTIAAETNHQKRGYDLEKFLNELFALWELDPKKSFKIVGEQIDGAFTYDGTDYLIEAKWKKQVDRADIAAFCSKVDSKLKIAMGLLVTIEGVTPEAIAPHFKSIIIMDGADISAIVEGRVTLKDLLYKKRRKAVETGEIFVSFFNLM